MKKDFIVFTYPGCFLYSSFCTGSKPVWQCGSKNYRVLAQQYEKDTGIKS